ncbi:50S ribosomal protein L28 [Candidatus Wolfebacteria bacterium]|nr:50S ribosomal protein L28 [Candidatus Wolfebacteria bacterium]
MRHCEMCGKGSLVRGARKKLRGKYNPTVKKRKYPNLQKTLSEGKRILACTSCIRTTAKTIK